MKLKLKYLAAAAAMAVASSAFAQAKGPADGGGEMFLNIWQVAGANGGTTSSSYTLDLQVTWSDFVANQNVNLFINKIVSDQYFTQMLTAASASLGALQFSVFGGDQQVDTPVNNLISTFAGATAKPENGGVLGTALDQIQNYTGALNATGSFVNQTGGGASYNTAGATYYGSGAGLNTLAGASSPNSGFVGSNLIVAQFTQNGFDPNTVPNKTIFPGTFYFGQQGGNYVLQYQVAAVPEPTGIALALAGFGVVGFVGRRRKSV
jgi:PEP-CTERM motif